MTPHMPEVDLHGDIEACFAKARQLSAGAGMPGKRCVAVVTPGRLIMPIPCPPPDAVAAEMLGGVRGIVSSQPKQAITVITFTDLIKQGALTPGAANSLIPFLGYIVGMAFDGHTVVAFECHPSALTVGCRDADVLIVDQAMVEHLQGDWVTVAGGVMKNSRILVFGRDGSIAAYKPPVAPQAAKPASGARRPWWWPFGKG